jgi:hypothetical protein
LFSIGLAGKLIKVLYKKKVLYKNFWDEAKRSEVKVEISSASAVGHFPDDLHPGPGQTEVQRQ